jgi:hypothetical protein
MGHPECGGNATAILVETPYSGMIESNILGVLRLALAPAVARARSGLGRFRGLLSRWRGIADPSR